MCLGQNAGLDGLAHCHLPREDLRESSLCPAFKVGPGCCRRRADMGAEHKQHQLVRRSNAERERIIAEGVRRVGPCARCSVRLACRARPTTGSRASICSSCRPTRRSATSSSPAGAMSNTTPCPFGSSNHNEPPTPTWRARSRQIRTQSGVRLHYGLLFHSKPRRGPSPRLASIRAPSRPMLPFG